MFHVRYEFRMFYWLNFKTKTKHIFAYHFIYEEKKNGTQKNLRTKRMWRVTLDARRCWANKMNAEKRRHQRRTQKKNRNGNFTVSASHGRIIIIFPLISSQMHEDMESLARSYYINSWCHHSECARMADVRMAESIVALVRQFFFLFVFFEERRLRVKGLKTCTTLLLFVYIHSNFFLYYFVLSSSHHSFTVRAHGICSTFHLSRF